MPTLVVPRFELLERLFSLIAEENEALLPGCRWLVLGPKLGAIVAAEEAPTLDELTALLRLLRRQTPDLQSLGGTLARNSEHGEDAVVELAVDRLLESSDWEHPTQMLERPRPDFGKLFAACRRRLAGAGPNERIEVTSVTAKVERAARIEESARARRVRRSGGSVLGFLVHLCPKSFVAGPAPLADFTPRSV
ncbi:MAG: hypothetical protein V3T72_07725 [Thermoanaerobaculia bacterium]